MWLRPTSEGLATAGLTGALLVVAVASGNNLLFLVVAVLLALWVLEVLLGSWNLRGVKARRSLPDELFAGQDASGAIEVRNPRRWLPAMAIEVLDPSAGAWGRIEEVAAGGQGRVWVHWRFERRGRARLERLLLRSRFPFGWLHHERVVISEVELLVYPAPTRGRAEQHLGDAAGDYEAARAARGGVGDFIGLRPYGPGDQLRSVHWTTSARLGQAMVVQRASESEQQLRVRLRQVPDEARESEISRATGEVLRGFRRGWRVGLALEDGSDLPARGGARWRRTLLDVLARLPQVRP